MPLDYDALMATELEQEFDEDFTRSSIVSLDELDGRSLLTRSRDALCWLFSPYL